MKQIILQKALKIRELQVSLGNIAHDDKRLIESYTTEEILAEAKYVLSTFNEGGHQNNDELNCEFGDRDLQHAARKQVAALKRLLNNG